MSIFNCVSTQQSHSMIQFILSPHGHLSMDDFLVGQLSSLGLDSTTIFLIPNLYIKLINLSFSLKQV